MEKQTNVDWREEITESKNTLKILDGQKVKGVFEDEGVKKSHPDFGSSIAFQFKVDTENEIKTWFVKANNFSLLAQIKQLGLLKGKHVEITRVGNLRSNTRYKIQEVK